MTLVVSREERVYVAQQRGPLGDAGAQAFVIHELLPEVSRYGLSAIHPKPVAVCPWFKQYCAS